MAVIKNLFLCFVFLTIVANAHRPDCGQCDDVCDNQFGDLLRQLHKAKKPLPYPSLSPLRKCQLISSHMQFSRQGSVCLVNGESVVNLRVSGIVLHCQMYLHSDRNILHDIVESIDSTKHHSCISRGLLRETNLVRYLHLLDTELQGQCGGRNLLGRIDPDLLDSLTGGALHLTNRLFGGLLGGGRPGHRHGAPDPPGLIDVDVLTGGGLGLDRVGGLGGLNLGGLGLDGLGLGGYDLGGHGLGHGLGGLGLEGLGVGGLGHGLGGLGLDGIGLPGLDILGVVDVPVGLLHEGVLNGGLVGDVVGPVGILEGHHPGEIHHIGHGVHHGPVGGVVGSLPHPPIGNVPHVLNIPHGPVGDVHHVVGGAAGGLGLGLPPIGLIGHDSDLVNIGGHGPAVHEIHIPLDDIIAGVHGYSPYGPSGEFFDDFEHGHHGHTSGHHHGNHGSGGHGHGHGHDSHHSHHGGGHHNHHHGEHGHHGQQDDYGGSDIFISLRDVPLRLVRSDDERIGRAMVTGLSGANIHKIICRGSPSYEDTCRCVVRQPSFIEFFLRTQAILFPCFFKSYADDPALWKWHRC